MIRHMTAITLLTVVLVGATLKSSEGADENQAEIPVVVDRKLAARIPIPAGEAMPHLWAHGLHTEASEPLTFQGHPAEWWARKTTHWKRAALARGRTLAAVKRATRRRYGATLMHGIELAATAYGQNASALRRVSYCESRHYLYARSSGGHLGPFQFAPSTWASTPYGRFSVFDPIAAPLAAAWMWRQGRRGEWACR